MRAADQRFARLRAHTARARRGIVQRAVVVVIVSLFDVLAPSRYDVDWHAKPAALRWGIVVAEIAVVVAIPLLLILST